MNETMVSADLVCPGCHFRCKLAHYQCGRGKEFFGMVAAGGELPERHGPLLTPSEREAAPGGLPPLNDRVMHGLNIAAARLRKRPAEPAERKILASLARGGSFMSLGILAKRAGLEREDLEAALAALQNDCLVVMDDEERTGRVARLTDAGAAQASTWKAERDAETAELLCALTDEEKETLAALLHKMLKIGR